MRVIISGGGIGGLTLALMLHRHGIPCLVLEAAAEVKPLGVGINALPHAIRELAALDLLPDLDAIAIRTRSLTYATQRSQIIWREPRGLYAGHDAPQLSIHRGQLQALLWRTAQRRLGMEAVRPGSRITGVKQDDTGVTVTMCVGDGSTATLAGDILVGADGIHSTLRALLHPDEHGIRWNGIQMWRGALDWPAFEGGDTMVVAGDAVTKLVAYPVGPGGAPDRRLTNWVVYAKVGNPDTLPPSRESWSQPGFYAEFAALTAGFQLPGLDVHDLAAATRQVFRYPMCDRDPLPFWTQDRVTLLGDAAHPMYPVGSNGASQAILDARCLSDLLAAHEPTAALRAYEAVRLPATADLVRANRIGGPERVIGLVAERAPEGFASIDDVASPLELAGIVGGYAGLAGFAVSADERRSVQ